MEKMKIKFSDAENLFRWSLKCLMPAGQEPKFEGEELNTFRELVDYGIKILGLESDYVRTGEDLELDPRKGIVFMGRVGTGKTFLARGLQKFLNKANNDLHLKLTCWLNTCENISDSFNQNGKIDQGFYSDKTEQGDLKMMAYDDLGREQEGMHFGDRREVMARIIVERHILWENHIASDSRILPLTFFTTNMDDDAITARYDARCFDRIIHMCNKIVLSGIESKRK